MQNKKLDVKSRRQNIPYDDLIRSDLRFMGLRRTLCDYCRIRNALFFSRDKVTVSFFIDARASKSEF